MLEPVRSSQDFRLVLPDGPFSLKIEEFNLFQEVRREFLTTARRPIRLYRRKKEFQFNATKLAKLIGCSFYPMSKGANASSTLPTHLLLSAHHDYQEGDHYHEWIKYLGEEGLLTKRVIWLVSCPVDDLNQQTEKLSFLIKLFRPSAVLTFKQAISNLEVDELLGYMLHELSKLDEAKTPIEADQLYVKIASHFLPSNQ